jgi:hypothetical protein
LSSKSPAQRENNFSPTDTTRFDLIINQIINNDIPGRKHWSCVGLLAQEKALLCWRDDAKEAKAI